VALEPENGEEKKAGAPRKSGFAGKYGGINIPGTRAGLIVSVGIAVLAWIAIPIARVFILGTAALGLLMGLLLWWRHTKAHERQSRQPDRRLDR
jgi:hypothetical protein